MMNKLNCDPKRKCKLSLMILLVGCIVGVKSASAQKGEITKKNIAFINYPDFPQANSTWDDIGYSQTYNKVYIGVTNHYNKVVLYAYDVASDSMEKKGNIRDLAHMRDFHWLGKIHSKFIEGPDGNIYFATDGGRAKQTRLTNNPRGFLGGYFLKWNPSTQKMTNLGMGLRFDSIKDMDIDPETGNLYGVTYPQVHFLVLDVSKNKLHDLGRLGGGHVPRVMFTDKWGNGYYVDWRERLVKYEKAKKQLIFARNRLPGFEGEPGIVTITGITAYAKDREKNIIYLTTYSGKLLAFHPQKRGIGRVEDLGGVIEKKDLGPGVKPWRAYTPDLALGHNGKLYYFIGSEGRYARKGKLLLMEADPKTKKKRILFEFPLNEVSYVSGSDVTDKDGNIYFGAMREVGNEDSATHKGAFMIKFNPRKEVR